MNISTRILRAQPSLFEKIENVLTIFILVLDYCFLFTEVQRGNLKRAIELFDKAIPLTNTELEMAHLFGLRDAAIAQINVSTKLGISLPSLGLMG